MQLENLQKLQRLNTEAILLKSQITNLYSDATSYTFPSSNAYHEINNSSINSNDASTVIFDDLTIEVSETLANQMELAMTRAGDVWATYEHPDPLDNQEINADLRKKTEEIFTFIHSSNFQQQISAVYRDLIIGTSAIKLTVVGSGKKKKLVFKHLNLGRISFLENGEGHVDTFFYKIEDFNIVKIKEMLGVSAIDVPDDFAYKEDGKVKNFSIVECCVPNGDRWDYSIVDDSFQYAFFTKSLSYNPFIVTRFSKRNDISSWGVGKAVERLSSIKSLQYFSKVEMAVIDRDSRPPYVASTPNTKQPDLSLENDVITFLPMGTTVEALFTNIDISKLSNKIADLKAQLKQAFLIDSILEAQAQNTYKTATEINIANQKFLDKFATYSSSIEEELPKQIFKRVYQLLSSEKMIEPIAGDIKHKIKFTNPITMGQKQKEVDKFVQMVQIAIGIVGQENVIAKLDIEKVIPWLNEKLSVDPVLFVSEEESQGKLEEIGEMQNKQAGIEPPMGNGGGMMDSAGMGGDMFG